MGKNKSATQTAQKTTVYPPVVAVLGHVDHGKTTLLDAIRKSNIAEREHGGITQRIGASTVEVLHDNAKRRITFIDTPGHEAFSRMRSRGAQAADIGLLIVSVVDSVMPQTKESIQLLKDTGIPFIVVLTKSDLPEKNPEKAKQQLLKEGVLLEGLGGDVPFIEVSAKTGKNIHELLELILLVFDVAKGAKPETDLVRAPFYGIVIESKLDQKAGPRVTLVMKSGMLSLRDELVCETIPARVRTIIDDKGKTLQQATVGEAIEVLGFTSVPPVGCVVTKKSEQAHVSASITSSTEEKAAYAPNAAKGTLAIILSTDTLGSLEAILQALPIGVQIVLQKTGEITAADILLAKTTGAIVLGFNTKISTEVAKQASVEKVPFKNYRIIYELIDEVKDVLEGKQLALEEKIYGKAKVLARFPFEKTFVMGIVVLEGRIAKGDKTRLMRGEEILGESTIASVYQGKNQVSKVEKVQEAGIILSPFLDFTIGDMILCHE